jgi:GT2 family glycosyltransferase
MQNLVSILIITYNSAETILEALNSVKAQTWNDLELIISLIPDYLVLTKTQESRQM